jgi:hypothetical protein
MSSGSPVEAVRRAFALLEELNRQRINTASAPGNRSSEVDHRTPAGDSSAPRLRSERSTTGRLPGDLGGSHTKLRIPW